MNSVNLVGRLTKTPELTTTANGTPRLSFAVACQRDFKDKTTGKYEADFPLCTAWRKTAEFIARHFRQGDPIEIKGRIQTGRYQDQNGQTHFTMDVLVDAASFVPQNKSDGGSGTPSGNIYNAPPTDDVWGDAVDPTFVPLSEADLPF